MKTTDDDEKVVKDRGVVRVPLFLMDATQKAVAAAQAIVSSHAPGFAVLTDAQSQARQRIYDAADRKLQDAWKAPASSINAKPPSPAISLDAARESYERRLRDAWRAQ